MSAPRTDRNFRAYFAGMLLGEAAVQVQSVAIAWHVYQLRHHAFDLALAGFAQFLPTFVFALVAGVFADRHDRRTIAVVAGILEAAVALAFAAMTAFNVREVVPYLATIFVLGTVRAFAAPAERALLPSIVARERFMAAAASYSSARELVVLLSPAFGGALVALGAQIAFAGAAAGLLAGAAVIATLRIARVEHDEPPTLRRALDGVRFIASRRTLAGAISLDLFAVLFGGVDAILPIYADTILHIGPIGLGALRSAPGAGAAVVALVVAHRPVRRHVGRTLLACVAGFGIATIAFALSKNVALSLAMLAIIGATDMVSVVIRQGLVQLGTPHTMRGRVNAVENVFIGASNQLGAFESGALAALLGAVASVVTGGIATLVVVVAWALAFPALRDADHIDEALADAPETPVR